MPTTKLGESGLGVDAQKDAVSRKTTEKGGSVLAEFTEVESGKKSSNRPDLLGALELCRRKRRRWSPSSIIFPGTSISSPA